MKFDLSGRSLPRGFTEPHILSGMPKNSPMLVAFSGGADSGALLDMIVRYAAYSGAPVYAAHVNHGIRGAEADRDEQFCRDSAEKYGIELFTLRADVPKLAAESGKSVETAARDLRYAFFAEIMQTHGIPLLCVAHNADDNFETILFNISRGSGLSGVCGIPQTRGFEGGLIIRPILGINKSDIIRYCSENNIEYVTDSTNTDTDYTRNRIRGRVIPELKAICPGAEYAAARLSESLRADASCLDSLAKDFVDKNRNEYFIAAKALCDAPYAVSSRALMSLYSEISGGLSLEYVHVKAILELAEKAVPHASLDLPASVRAVFENGALGFTKAPPPPKNIPAEEISVPLRAGINFISQINAEIVIGNTQKSENIYKKSMNFSLDSAKILGALYARERRAGDKIKMGGMSKSIKKLMCDRKIPQELRPRIPVICDDSGIIAVPFIGACDACTARKGTDSPISVEFGLIADRDTI